jgi:uncharacterized protein YggE
MNNSALIATLVAVMLLTAGVTLYASRASAPLVVLPQNQSTQLPQITVDGQATTKLAPDLLTVDITIGTTDASAFESETDNAAQTAQAKAALLALGVSETELQTESYSTNPNYNQTCQYYPQTGGSNGVAIPIEPNCQQTQTVVSYTTDNEFTINTANTSSGGAIIQAVTSATSDAQVNDVQFGLQPATQSQTESTLDAQAAQDAQLKAQSIASGLGVKLGSLISVSESYNPVYTPMTAFSSANAAEGAFAPTQLYPTDLTLDSAVTVTYGVS